MTSRGGSVLQLYHAWINSILKEEDRHVESLSQLQDGDFLYQLIDILFPESKNDRKYQASRNKVAIQKIQGVLDLLYRNGVKVSVGSHEILQGDTKALLDVLWGIILNLFLHTPERPPTQRTVRIAKRNLLDWCKQQQPDLPFNIHASLGKNFGKSDALARIIGTNCYVEKSEDLVEFLSSAITATEDQFGIEREILNPLDIVDGTIDEHALLVYLALVRRKSKLNGNVNISVQVNGPSLILPNGIPEEHQQSSKTSLPPKKPESPRRSPSPRITSPREASPAQNPSRLSPSLSSPINPQQLLNESCQSTPKASAGPFGNQVEADDDDDNPITFEVPASSPPRPCISPHRSPAPSPRQPLSPRSRSRSPISIDLNADLVIDLTDSGDQKSPRQSELLSPRKSPRSYTPAESPRQKSPRSYAPTESPEQKSPRSYTPTESPGQKSPRSYEPTESPEQKSPRSYTPTESPGQKSPLSYTPAESPRQQVSPRQTLSEPWPRLTSPEKLSVTFQEPEVSTSPRSSSPGRVASPSQLTLSESELPLPYPSQEPDLLIELDSSPYQVPSTDTRSPCPDRPPTSPRSSSPYQSLITGSPSNYLTNGPSIGDYNRAPLSPESTRRHRSTSPLGSPRSRGLHLSPRNNGYNSSRSLSPNNRIARTMDPSDRLELNGFDEKVIGHMSDGDQPNSARSARSDETSDWLSSSTGSVKAYNVSKGNDEVSDSGVDTELAEAIKNKISEHFHVDSQTNTPRAADGECTASSNLMNEQSAPSASGMSKSLSTDDLLTMLEAIGHQGKTLRDELMSREQELMFMHAQTETFGLPPSLVEQYERDMEKLQRENEILSKQVASAQSTSLPEREIVNKLLLEISEMRVKMDTVETKALSPRDEKSPRLDLDSGFKESVRRLSQSMDNLDQKLGAVSRGGQYRSMESLNDRSSLYSDNTDSKPPSGAFRHAELRWHEQEKSLKEQISAQKRHITELERLVEITKNENKDLQRKLDKASTNITNRVNEMDAMINETRRETETLQTENDDLKAARQKDKQLIQQFEDRIISLEKSLAKLQRENTSLTDQLQASLKKSRAANGTTERLDALMTENTNTKEKLSEAEEEKRKLHQNVEKYMKRCQELEGRLSRDPSPNKPPPAQSARPGSPLKQNVPSAKERVQPNETTASPVISRESSPKRNPPKVAEQVKIDMTGSSPTKNIGGGPETAPSPEIPREDRSPERPKLNSNNRYQHHERVMIQARQAIQDVDFVPDIKNYEMPIDLAELSRKYPELDRYSKTAWEEDKPKTRADEYHLGRVDDKTKASGNEQIKAFDKERPKAWGDEPPRSQVEEKPRIWPDEKSRSRVEVTQPRIEEKPRSRTEDMTRAWVEEKHNAWAEEKPQPRTDERPKQKIEQKYRDWSEEKPRSAADQRPRSWAEEKPRSRRDENPRVWEQQKSRANPEDRKFEDVVERVSVVSKTLDSELEKSRDLYQKLQTPKVLPISRARLRSEELRSPENPSGRKDMRQTNVPDGQNIGRSSDPRHRSSARSQEERTGSARLGHRRTNSSPGNEPEKGQVDAEEQVPYRSRQYGSLQNLSSDRARRDNSDRERQPVSSYRSPYRSSSADRLVNGHSNDREQVQSPSKSPPVPDHKTPITKTNIRDILQKRFGSAPLPQRMSSAFRGRKSEETTPTKNQGKYNESRSRGSVPVRVVHNSVEAAHDERRTPKSAWDESGSRGRDHRGRDAMPRRQIFENERQRVEDPEPRSQRSEERNYSKPPLRPGSRYRESTPTRISDRYHQETSVQMQNQQPPVITVTPPEEMNGHVAVPVEPRQFNRFSDPDSRPRRSASDRRHQRSSDSYSQTKSAVRSQNVPPQSHQRPPERQQTPPRTPTRQAPSSSNRERHPSSPSRLTGQSEQRPSQQDWYESGQLVNWRVVAREYGADVDMKDDYPYFGVTNNPPAPQPVQRYQYMDYNRQGGEPEVYSCESESVVMDENGIYREIPVNSPPKSPYMSHRRTQSVDSKKRTAEPADQGFGSYGQYNSGAPQPSSPLKGNPQLRDSPTHRSASSISQMSTREQDFTVSSSPADPNDPNPPKLSPAQIAYVDSLIEKYTRT